MMEFFSEFYAALVDSLGVNGIVWTGVLLAAMVIVDRIDKKFPIE